MKRLALSGILVSLALGSSFALAAPGLAFDASLGFTTNADLVQDNPESDLIAKVGGVYRFPTGSSQGRFSLSFTDYVKRG